MDGNPGSAGGASVEAGAVTFLSANALSLLRGRGGVLGGPGRFRGISFGSLLKKASHSGLMGASRGVDGRVDWMLLHNERVASGEVLIPSGDASGAVSVVRAGSSVMRSV